MAKGATESESFVTGLLEYPQFTRPAIFGEWAVPEVLLSGHHEVIRKWRREQSLRLTLDRRPDLLETTELTREDRRLLEHIKAECQQRDICKADLSAESKSDEES